MRYALVAQLDRASDYGSEGCEFEPRRVHHIKPPIPPSEVSFYVIHCSQLRFSIDKRYKSD